MQVKISPVFHICLSVVCGLGVWVGGGERGWWLCVHVLGGLLLFNSPVFRSSCHLYVSTRGGGGAVCAYF